MNAPVGRRFVAIWVALVVAGSLLALAARGAGPLPGDLLLTRSLQRSSPSGVVNLLLTRAGDAVWFLPPLTILIALVGKRWLAAFFALLAASTGVLIPDAIKLLVARPRPATDLVWVLSPQENYGFPSGTAFLSVVFLGTVGYLIWREYPRPHVAVVTFGVSAVDLVERPLAGVRRGALGDRRLGWLVLRGCLADDPRDRPPLVAVEANEGIEDRRSYGENAKAAMT